MVKWEKKPAGPILIYPQPLPIKLQVKQKIDKREIRQSSLLPIGDGNYILPVNGAMRKTLNKKNGDKIQVVLQLDKEEIKINSARIVISKFG